jgi:hypothetical protein
VRTVCLICRIRTLTAEQFGGIANYNMPLTHFPTYTLVDISLQAAPQLRTEHNLDLSSAMKELDAVSDTDKLEQDAMAENVKGLEVGISTMNICDDEVMHVCALCACQCWHL